MTSTTRSSQPVAFIIGAGPHIGTTVAHTLYEQGYTIALGSRQPQVEVEHMDKFSPVIVDVTQPESIKAAFNLVVKEFGHPSVVVYNAASFVAPPNPYDPLSLGSKLFHDFVLIGSGVFTAAQEAIRGFRHKSTQAHPRVFIVTGNALAFKLDPNPIYFGLTIQKSIEAQLIATFANSYKEEGFGFYFASLVSSTGELAGAEFTGSAAIHARVYWELVQQHHGQENWDHRFTLDGKRHSSCE